MKPAPKKVHASKQTVQNGKTKSQSHKNILKERIVPREQRHNTSKINIARDTLSNAWVQVFPPHKRHNTKRSWIFKTCGSISCYSVLRLLNSLQVFGCTDPSKFCVIWETVWYDQKNLWSHPFPAEYWGWTDTSIHIWLISDGFTTSNRATAPCSMAIDKGKSWSQTSQMLCHPFVS